MTISDLSPTGLYSVVVDFLGCCPPLYATENKFITGRVAQSIWPRLRGKVRYQFKLPPSLVERGCVKVLCPDGTCLVMKPVGATPLMVDTFGGNASMRDIRGCVSQTAAQVRKLFEAPLIQVAPRRSRRIGR